MRFKKVYIEITNTCNFSCSFCFQNSRKQAYMQPADFRDVVERIWPFTDYIYLHVLGEPLLHPFFSDILEIALNKGLQINLTTNGSLLHKNAGLLAKTAVRQINISLHDADENIPVENLESYLNQVCEAARLLSHKTVMSLRLWNLGADKDVFNLATTNFLFNYFNVCDPGKDFFKTNRNFQLASNVFLQKAQRFEWPDNETVRNTGLKKCYALRDHIAILVDGTVVPCCIDAGGTIKLGNIFEQSVFDIINSDKAVRILEGFKQRKIVEQLCNTCGFII